MSKPEGSRFALPPLLRRVILILSATLLMFGLMISCRQSDGRADDFLDAMSIWLALTAAFAALFVGGYFLLTAAAGKRTESDLSRIFEAEGWSGSAAEIAKSSFRHSTAHNKVLALFLSVMAEQYDRAVSEELGISESGLSGRDLAAYRTCQLRTAVMTGKSQRAHRLFADHAGMLDAEYQYQPDFEGRFTPYAEDALVYYETAAALCEREGQHDRAEQYFLQAKLRIGQYPEAVQPFFERLIALSMQYARAGSTADSAAAKAEEAALRQQIAGQTGLNRGMRNNLLRMLQQCSIFGVWTQETLTASGFERKLPPAEP